MSDCTNPDDINSKAILEGDTVAFEELFKRNYQSLCNYCQGIVTEHDKAEDIVQDVFVYLWNNRSSIDIKVSLKHYLYSSVRHGALKVLKRQLMEQRHSPLLTEFIENLQHSEYSEEEVVEIEQMKKALASLPQQCRNVFLMSCVDEKPYKQIAEELNISVNTVKTHITKAYRIIRGNFRNINQILMFIVYCRKTRK
jgi:RNA polymerase sigma-70 factor